MNCREFTALIDDYLTCRLADGLKEPFEEHYFACDSCFLELRVRERFMRQDVAIVPDNRIRLRVFKPMLAAASLVIAAFLVITLVTRQRPDALLEEISAFTPPAFFQSETRSPVTGELFNNAMARYSHRDYRGALALVEQIPGSARDNPQVTFFSGIIYLLNKRYGAALERFDTIIATMNPAYFDEAIFYRGITLLRLNRTEEALAELEHLSGMFSPYAPKARTLIERVNAAL
jgi:tetratricopeptide (TPR) repeat protein